MKNFNLTRAKPKDLKSTFFRLMSYFKGAKLFLLILVVCLTIFSSIASIFGTFMLKTVISDILNLKSDPSYKYHLIKSISIVASLYIAGVLSTITYNRIMVVLSQKVIYQIRSELINHTLKLPISEFDKYHHGEIMSYFTNDIDTLNNTLNDSFANIIFSFANIVGTLIGIFVLNVYLSLIVVFFLSLMVFFIIYNSHLSRKYFKNQQVELSNMNAFIEENIKGIKISKSFNHKDEDMVKFDINNKNLKETATKSFFRTQLNVPVIVALSYFNFAISCIIGIIFTYKGYLVGGVAALTSFLVYVRQSAAPFNHFTGHVNSILTSMAGAERIFEFLDKKEEIDEGNITLIKVDNEKSKYAWSIPLENGQNRIIPLEGNIEFKNLTFGYNENKTILKNISFIAESGKKVSFVGSTGAGKTTIISLITRFYEINDGEILYDSLNIKNIKKESLRRAISLVTQDTHLFSETIEENIKYVRRHSTKEEILEASSISNADHFISRLPNGYETLLYDDGKNLSEGQRQLLSLTRAALSKPPLLILDEATSNIDTHTEKLIQVSLEKLMENRTVLIIAHRLSTIRNSDLILVLSDGKIIEQGNHEELLNLKGFYYSLYKGKEELS